jgi:hypothetical protein
VNWSATTCGSCSWPYYYGPYHSQYADWYQVSSWGALESKFGYLIETFEGDIAEVGYWYAPVLGEWVVCD